MLIKYVAKRLVFTIPVMLGASLLIFLVVKLPPGDFISYQIMSMELVGIDVDTNFYGQLRQTYGLDKSDFQQYLIWIGNIITRWDFGMSFSDGNITWVNTMVADRMKWTLIISFMSLFVSYMIAIPAGMYAAVKKNGIGDYVVGFIGFIGMAIPGFMLALVIAYLIWLNTGVAFVGMFPREYIDAPWSMAKFLSMLPRLGLAVGLIGLTGTASTIRIMRAMTLDELEKQYVTTARSKGLEENKLLWKYPLRMALSPIVSTIGWTFPALISGEIVLSAILSYPTIGPMLRKSFGEYDTYLSACILLFIAALTILGTVISDVLLAINDPRIRFDEVGDNTGASDGSGNVTTKSKIISYIVTLVMAVTSLFLALNIRNLFLAVYRATATGYQWSGSFLAGIVTIFLIIGWIIYIHVLQSHFEKLRDDKAAYINAALRYMLPVVASYLVTEIFLRMLR